MAADRPEGARIASDFDRLGKVGIWSPSFRTTDKERSLAYGRELERLGYRAVWVPGGEGGALFHALDTLLQGTQSLTVAAGILNIWMHAPSDTAAWIGRNRRDHPGRLLVGLGASHAVTVEKTDRRWTRPLAHLDEYVNQLALQPEAVRGEEIFLAALGPKALRLAASKTLGAHTYFVTPEHTAHAREVMGDGALLVPELKVVWEQDPRRARRIARAGLELYLGLPNYTRNLLALGFEEEDFAHGGSDRLVDKTVAWGPADVVRDRIRQHLDSGADHVCLQVLREPGESPVDAWTALAEQVLPSFP